MGGKLTLTVALVALFCVGLVSAQEPDPFLLDFERPYLLETNASSQPITDTAPPTWSGQTQSLSAPDAGDTVLLYALLEDDTSLSQAILATNETGPWTNWTDRHLSPIQIYQPMFEPLPEIAYVNSTWAVFSWENPSIENGTTVAWRIWFNDTSGNWNVTDTMSFTVTARLPRVVNRTHNSTCRTSRVLP